MTMADRDGLTWLDGAMVRWREAKVHVLIHTLHYGMGVFEGIRAYGSVRPSIAGIEPATDGTYITAPLGAALINNCNLKEELKWL
jgi:branched-chain amino acid aminotransferase